MAENVTVTIDDREVSVPAGMLVVDAAAKVNIEIPIFCSHPKLDPVGCCRMCMVEIEGPRGSRLMTACTMPVQEGMVVHTKTDQVREVQEANLGFILLNHPLDCPICDKGGECPLQDQTMRYGPGISQLVEPKRLKKKHYLISDTIVLDQERCVLCWRCIRYLEEWEDKPQLGLFERGNATIIDIQDGQPVDAKTSGNIIDICPVGALTSRVARFSFRPWEIERTPSVCNHCSVGCNMRLDSRTHSLRRIIGRENMAVNDIWLCDKGRFASAWVNSEERLTMPLLRKNGTLEPVQWKEALQFIASRLDEIKTEHGADAVGGIGSAKLPNEANYLLQRFMRQVIGTNNVDHRDGGDVWALPTGLPALADVMKPQYGPDPKTDTVLVFGIDPEEELPILNVHLKRAARRAGMNVIVAHPRRIDLSQYGTHLGYTPGSEATLLNGLVKAAIDSGVELKSNTQAGLDKLKEWTADAGDDVMQDQCSVDAQLVKDAARLLAESEHALILYGPMLAHGSEGRKVMEGLVNLAALTGHYDRLAYLGLEANSQGCRDVGLLPDKLPGHADLDDDDAVRRLRSLWGAALPTRAGKTYSEMLNSAGGHIRALYVMGANPASERPDWAANLDKLDLLVVQDLLDTETVQRADVVLPALSWAEEDGTFTNLERRVQRAPKAVNNPETRAAADWMILDHLATRMGVNWPFADMRGVTREISRAVPAYAGLTWDALGDQGLQWDAEPVRPKPLYRQARQGKISGGDDEFALVSGTVLYDGGTLFRLTDQMHGISFGRRIAICPEDAAKYELDEGTSVSVRSPEGVLELAVAVDERVKPGTAWIPEGLPGAPVGTLLNGSVNQRVRVEKKATEE